MMNKLWIAIALVFAGTLPITAQPKEEFNDAVKKIEGRFEPSEARPGQLVTFKLEVQLNPGWYTYATFQPDPQAKSSTNLIVLPQPSSVIFVEPVQDPATYKTKQIPELNIKESRYYPDGATWEFKAIVSPKASPGPATVKLQRFRILVCVKKGDQENCLPPKVVPVEATLKILDGGPEKFDRKYRYTVNKAINEANPEDALAALTGSTGILSLVDQPEIKVEQDGQDPGKKSVALLIQKDRDYAADIETLKKIITKYETSNDGFVAFVLTAMFWGIVTLLTPCVFPMVPITVSYFLKQGEKKQHNTLTMAIVYTLTIVVVLGVAALFFLAAFQRWAVSLWMNAALGVLFVVFALSLFGMFDLVLPNFLVRFTSAREGKGGYGGVIFMALSFSIVSFTCVAPFLGGFAGMAASGNFSDVQLLAGSLAFAGAFAAPFFLLAMFPSLIKKMPKSGGWMNTIKVVMGFLELAAALKFFRTAELRWSIPPTIFTYDFVLSMWIVILFLNGLYLLNLYRLPHDEPQEHIGVPRMLIGLVSIAIGVYLLPAMFAIGNHEKQRPSGTIYAWVDSFLLPEPSNAEILGGGELTWSGDLLASIEDAREKNQVVFVDFTGVTCTNCKLNEQNVFPKPAIKELFKKFRLVQMYTDEIPAPFYAQPPDDARREAHAILNQQFQRDRFGTTQLPLYVLLKPKPGARGGPVEIIGVYSEGKINKEKDFIEFLQKGVK